MAHGISRGVLKLVQISTLIKKKSYKKKGYKRISTDGHKRFDNSLKSKYQSTQLSELKLHCKKPRR
jgi:hypothetical protein